MSNGSERQGIPGSENPKEVKPMSEGYKFFKASVALSEVKKSEPKMSDDEALDYVVEHMDVDKVRFTAWLKTLGENMAPPKKEKRFHSPEEIQDYEDRNPQHYA